MKITSHPYVRPAVKLVAVAALIAGVWSVGPAVERVLFPVLTDLELVQVEPMVGGMRFRLQYDKRRDCTPLSLFFFGIDTDDRDRRSFAVHHFPDGSTGITYRPVGHNISRRITARMEADADAIEAVLTYRCRWVPWQTVVRAGPWPRPVGPS